MPMSHCVDKDFSQVPSTTSLYLPGSLLFYMKDFINIFSLWSDYLRKIMRFQSKTNLTWSLFLIGFDFAIMFTCVFYGIFYSSTIMKLRINNLLFAWLQIWSLIKLCDVTQDLLLKHSLFENYKLLLFFRFSRKLSSICYLVRIFGTVDRLQ